MTTTTMDNQQISVGKAPLKIRRGELIRKKSYYKNIITTPITRITNILKDPFIITVIR